MLKDRKILTILGARPQFIKAATVSRVLSVRRADGKQPALREIIVHTGQHHDLNMSDAFFAELNLPQPTYNLGINGLSHGVMTGKMLEKIEEIIIFEKPDMVLVYGDTNSTLAGALAAVKLHVPVAHVEAGLRSGNMNMPEEINRILTDRISSLLFCPTTDAVKNLEQEGIRQNVFQVGDVMYDAHLFYRAKATRQIPAIKTHGLSPQGYILTTLHRAENTDNIDRLHAIYGALTTIAKQIPVVFPVHPRTKKAMAKADLFDQALQHLTIIPPVGYIDMLKLQRDAALIVTDSGGVQKEAFFANVPCLTIREQTEWTELIEFGSNVLVRAEKKEIIDKVENLISTTTATYQTAAKHPYGDGNSASKIIDIIGSFLSCNRHLKSKTSKD